MANQAKFGLALGGGGIHGVAHLGVLEVLERHRLSPGWLVGTSAGAIAAAFAAFGIPAKESEQALMKLSWASLTRARPRAHLGWATNEKLEEILVHALGDVRIEDSEVPLGVIATDIGTGDRVLLDHGRVATAVRASCCVPGLYQPVEIDGRLLVDGSLVENVPARAVRELGAPLVVAVSLGFELPFEPPGSWVQALANALDIAINSQMHYEIPAEADVLIDPDLGGLSQVRTRDSVAILEAGRHRAEEAMPVLRELLRRNEGNAVSRWVKSVKKRMRRKGA